MCTQRVTDRYAESKPGLNPSGRGSLGGSGESIEGWPGHASRQPRKRAAREARDGRDGASVCEASTAAWPRRAGILDHSLLNVPAIDDRGTLRQELLILTDAERSRVRWMARQAAGCGARWMAFRGYQGGESTDKELRLICQAKCGTRACAECSKRIRARECGRVSGPWKLFFTFTIPRVGRACGDEWRAVHRYIGKLTKKIKKTARVAAMDALSASAIKQKISADQVESAKSVIRSSSGLHYAWVIEPHKDGYPHVHMVVNAEWISYAWIRATWEDIIQADTAWVYGEKVYEVDGTCRYLSKYISKASLTPDILAIMYRRRLWASTIDKPEKPEPKWFREDATTTTEAFQQSENPKAWGELYGWTLASRKQGGYAIWERETIEGYSWGERWKVGSAIDDRDYANELSNTYRSGVRIRSRAGDMFSGDDERISAIMARK